MKKFLFILLFIILKNNSFADDKMELGLEVYNEKAANSDGDIGPNLDMLKPQIPQIIIAVANGIGVMAPWKGILTDEEIEAVAYYVFNSTNN